MDAMEWVNVDWASLGRPDPILILNWLRAYLGRDGANFAVRDIWIRSSLAGRAAAGNPPWEGQFNWTRDKILKVNCVRLGIRQGLSMEIQLSAGINYLQAEVRAAYQVAMVWQSICNWTHGHQDYSEQHHATALWPQSLCCSSAHHRPAAESYRLDYVGPPTEIHLMKDEDQNRDNYIRYLPIIGRI